jgi:hypothetical protein
MNIPHQSISPRVAALLAETKASTRHARVALIIDATGSRQENWDLSMSLQASMAEEAAKIGGLNIQLIHFGGDRMQTTEWSDPVDLISYMRGIRCLTGKTMIEQALKHVRAENMREKITASVYIGDACEEPPAKLYNAATGLVMPLFAFQEGEGVCRDQNGYPLEADIGYVSVAQVFKQLAHLTGGAYSNFDTGSARQLGELLRAVAGFATGGLIALSNQKTEGARLLLGQLRRTP